MIQQQKSKVDNNLTKEKKSNYRQQISMSQCQYKPISKPQIQQQYRQLKNRVEDEIRLLQQKLSHNTEIHYHRGIVGEYLQENNSQYGNYNEVNIVNQLSHHQRSHSHSHSHLHLNCCHHNNHHCHQSTNRCISQIYPSDNNGDSTSNIINHKLIQQNILFQKAYIRSIQQQQSLSSNIRLLENKLSRLQLQQQLHNNNNAHKHYIRSHSKLASSKLSRSNSIQSLSSSIIKSRSQAQYNSKFISKQKQSKSKLNNKLKHHRPNNNTIQSDVSSQYLLTKSTKPKKLSKPQMNNIQLSKHRHNNHWEYDYYGRSYGQDNLFCPVHSDRNMLRLPSKQKQVYKDSNYRNRKHQRNHLIQSFKQQQIARNKIISKILTSSNLNHINPKPILKQYNSNK